MNQPISSSRGVANGASKDEAAATENDTRDYLLQRSKRDHAPVPKVFVQNPDKSLKNRAGPLAEFVRAGDVRALKALLFLHAFISSGAGDNGWSATLPLKVWARAFDTTKTADSRSASSAATKILTRLVQRKMIDRQRTGRARNITVTLLRPDGSGEPYTRPDGSTPSNYFLKLSHKYWTDGWYERLDLAATAMLLVALHEDPAGFALPTERVPEWYGWSADTAERGMKTLRDEGIVDVERRLKKAPLAPSGLTQVNWYTVIGPLAAPPAPKKSLKKAAKKTGAAKTAGAATATKKLTAAGGTKRKVGKSWRPTFTSTRPRRRVTSSRRRPSAVLPSSPSSARRLSRSSFRVSGRFT